MLGTKVYKTYIENPDGGLGFWEYDEELYAKCAVWCNETQLATIEDKGEYYEVVEIPAPSLDELKQVKLQEVDTYTANKITGGFVSLASGEPVTYDSDKDTQLTMQGIALNVQTPLFVQEYPNGCPVRGYILNHKEHISVHNLMKEQKTKDVLWLNADQVMRWCADMSMHIGMCKQRGWELQAQVKACTTKEELEAIVLE